MADYLIKYLHHLHYLHEQPFVEINDVSFFLISPPYYKYLHHSCFDYNEVEIPQRMIEIPIRAG